MRKALARLLQSVRLTVETYSGGAEFLAALGTHRPDCAVLDLHMPEVTGFDVLQRLAAMDACLPVVVITGHDTADAEASVLRGGASAYLHKPVNQRLLLDAIATAIARSANPTQRPL